MVPLEPGPLSASDGRPAGGQASKAAEDGATTRRCVPATADGRRRTDDFATPAMTVENATAAEELFILERMAWTDQAATAAEVTALQCSATSSRAKRFGRVRNVRRRQPPIVFTDLRSSTEPYREIGERSPLRLRSRATSTCCKAAIAAEWGDREDHWRRGDGRFHPPGLALRAMLRAHRPSRGRRHRRSLALKVGIHAGPCIAVTQNDRLDYFGSTINIAARLEGQSSGHDVIVSEECARRPGGHVGYPTPPTSSRRNRWTCR